MLVKTFGSAVFGIDAATITIEVGRPPRQRGKREPATYRIGIASERLSLAEA